MQLHPQQVRVMARPRKKQDLKLLQKEWDEILKASGFKDIERRIGNDLVLIQYASNVYRQAEPVIRENKAAYYEQISSWIHEHKFANESEKIIMNMIGQGARIKEVVQRLESMGVGVHRQTVRFIIRRYETEWGIKVWSNKQMNLKMPIK